MSAAELSTAPDRHPWDWYQEQPWVTEVLLDMLPPLDPDAVYLDPACGACTIPSVLTMRGLQAYGTDIARRTDHPRFLAEHDFLGDQVLLLESYPRRSFIMNPPFSYQDGRLVRGLAERFVRRALATATDQVAVLLPLKWLASQGRARLFAERAPDIYILTERPSMPPGDKIAAMGKRAWARGKVDYMWLVWDLRLPPLPYGRTFWIPPRPKVQPQLDLAEAA